MQGGPGLCVGRRTAGPPLEPVWIHPSETKLFSNGLAALEVVSKPMGPSETNISKYRTGAAGYLFISIISFSLSLSLYIYIYVYVYIYIYIYIYVCMYVCMYIYIEREGYRDVIIGLRSGWGSDGNVYNVLRGLGYLGTKRGITPNH